jgi:hypothetical protein
MWTTLTTTSPFVTPLTKTTYRRRRTTSARAPGIRPLVRILVGDNPQRLDPGHDRRAYGVPLRRTGFPVVAGEDRLEVAEHRLRQENPPPYAVWPGLQLAQALAQLRRRPMVAADGRFARSDARAWLRPILNFHRSYPGSLSSRHSGSTLTAAILDGDHEPGGAVVAGDDNGVPPGGVETLAERVLGVTRRHDFHGYRPGGVWTLSRVATLPVLARRRLAG